MSAIYGASWRLRIRLEPRSRRCAVSATGTGRTRELRQQLGNARRELARAERLLDVRARTGHESSLDVGLLCLCAEQHDGQSGRLRVGAQAAQHLEAVDLWHRDVEHDEIGLTGAYGRESLCAVRDRHHLVT